MLGLGSLRNLVFFIANLYERGENDMLAQEYSYNPFEDYTYDSEKFLNILHHDSRNGFVKMMKFYSDSKRKGYATKDLSELYFSQYENCNSYVTINSFKSIEKSADNFFSINAMYFDLDMHGYRQDYIDFCTENTLATLNKSFEAEDLPYPTMITKTGRGLGLYYVLNKSIPNLKASQKAVAYWKAIYSALFNRISSSLSLHNDVLELDSTSKCDIARIVRVPGTKNLNNGRLCKLDRISYRKDDSVQYYSLPELAYYVSDLLERKPKKKVKKKVDNIVNFNAYKFPFLKSRLAKLEALQQNFNDVCTEKRRELMCFFYYNSAKQLDPKNSMVLLYAFNDGFNVPLPHEELIHVMDSVDSNKAPQGNYEGYYKIKEKHIIEKLGLTEEEISVCGFGGSVKQHQRELTKEQNRLKKAKRDKAIIEMVLMSPEMTYDEIAKIHGVSLRTLKNIVSEAGISRYNKQCLVSDDEIKAEDKIIIEEEIIEMEQRISFLAEKCKKMPVSLKSSVHISRQGVGDYPSQQYRESGWTQLSFDLERPLLNSS